MSPVRLKACQVVVGLSGGRVVVLGWVGGVGRESACGRPPTGLASRRHVLGAWGAGDVRGEVGAVHEGVERLGVEGRLLVLGAWGAGDVRGEVGAVHEGVEWLGAEGRLLELELGRYQLPHERVWLSVRGGGDVAEVWLEPLGLDHDRAGALALECEPEREPLAAGLWPCGREPWSDCVVVVLLELLELLWSC